MNSIFIFEILTTFGEIVKKINAYLTINKFYVENGRDILEGRIWIPFVVSFPVREDGRNFRRLICPGSRQGRQTNKPVPLDACLR